MISNPIHSVYIRSRALYRELKAKTLVLTTDLNHLDRFVLFIGNPRSGTTLIRTLLDAHPSIVIGNEVHIINLLKMGKDWHSIQGNILENSRRFSRSPIWTDYSYWVEKTLEDKDAIRVIGDKKAGGSTKILMGEPDVLFELTRLLPIPIHLIHCVRHPHDVITTKTLRNGRPIEFNCGHYFALEKTAAELSLLVGNEKYKRIYHEELIANPGRVLKDTLGFLGLTAKPEYLRACQSLVYDKPHQSRFKMNWTEKNLAAVEQGTSDCEHLSYYLDQGKLLFNR